MTLAHGCPELSCDAHDLRLLNDFQRDFPCVARPFAQIGEILGLAEDEVLARYQRLREGGALSRIGPVFAARRVGASTLAALRVPPARLEDEAARVSACAGVNHNYARDHDWNLWFVATAPEPLALARSLRDIRRAARSPLIALPLLSEYHIDLGFDLAGGAGSRGCGARAVGPQPAPDALGALVMAGLQAGLPLRRRPFARIAREAGIAEEGVFEVLESWLAAGMLKRFGVVVRHHELGFRANAMCVWDVPDERVDDFGRQLAAAPGVTLCYRRRRAFGRWPYNLYCMIHGREQAEVRGRIAALTAACGLERHAGEVLFSTRRFKQCGARYFGEAADA